MVPLRVTATPDEMSGPDESDYHLMIEHDRARGWPYRAWFSHHIAAGADLFLMTGVSKIMHETTVSELREVHLLSPAHAAGLRMLAREPDVAGVAAISVAPTPEETAEYIEVAAKAQDDGKSYIFVLTHRTEVLGICRLIGVLGVPRLIVAIGHAYRGQGNGSFLVRHVLEFAFETLQLERITATGACLGLVSQFGQLDGNGLTRLEWQTGRVRG